MDSVPSLELYVRGEGDNKALMGGRLLMGLSIARHYAGAAPRVKGSAKSLYQRSDVSLVRLALIAGAMSGRE